jgi:hypothetical protein
LRESVFLWRVETPRIYCIPFLAWKGNARRRAKNESGETWKNAADPGGGV